MSPASSRQRWWSTTAALAATLAIVAGSAAPAGAGAPSNRPQPGSPAYLARDAQNMVSAFGRDEQELTGPAYLAGLPRAVVSAYLGQIAAQGADPTNPAITPGNLVPGWDVGNPDRTRWAGTRGREVAVRFTAADGALLVGDVFAPLPGARDPYTHQRLGAAMPGVVLVTGSIQAAANMYSWLAEDLAERGYLVLTFDVQGQGRSETFPHQGPVPALPGCGTKPVPGQATGCTDVPSEQQANFDQDLEDAIDFFLSTPSAPYPDVADGASPVDAFNPLWKVFDRSPDPRTVTRGRTTRLAVIGHSTGAVTVSWIQGIDDRVAAAVALDKITATANAIEDDKAELGSLPSPVVPTVPTLGIQSEYGFAPQPYWEASCSSFEPCPAAPGGSVSVPDLHKAPDPDREEITGFDAWEAEGVDSMVVVPRASTHLDYTDEPPSLPASRLGQAMASYYVQGWLDKYLKHEPGADRRLLATSFRYLEPEGGGVWTPIVIDRNQQLSFYFCSGYDFHVEDGAVARDPDIVHDGCS